MRDQSHPTSTQAHIQHGIPPYNFSRRYACDRCRGQKLRCIRDQMSADGSCQRCRKAREKCTIAPSVRSGPAQERLTEMALEAANLQRPAPASSPTSTRPVNAVAPPQPWEPEMDNGQSDGLHLTSVPWLDLVGPSFDVGSDLNFGTTAVGEEGRLGTGTGAGTTVTGAMEGTATSSATAIMSITPTSQHTNATSYSFPSIPDNFDFSPRFDISMENIAPATSEKETQHNNQPPRTGAGEAPINERDKARTERETRHKSISMGLSNLPVPSPPNGIGQSREIHREGSASSTSSSSSSAELKDRCIQELADLSASLMKELHRVISCKLASSFLFTPSDRSPAEFIFRTLDGSVSNDNAIGRMLQGTEKFLEIVQLFHQPVHSAWSFPDLSLGGDFAAFASRLENASDAADASPEAQMEKRWRILQSYLHGGQNSSAMSLPGAGSWLTEHLTSGISQKPDVTSTLSVLTCYTCLLRIYETVFYVIHHSLECSPSLAPAIKLPQTVPGLEINGFMLRNHRSLQIKILLQVSTYMLDSVEKTLAPMLSDSTFQALLKTLLRQEGLECSPGNETGMSSVRRLMMKVDSILK